MLFFSVSSITCLIGFRKAGIYWENVFFFIWLGCWEARSLSGRVLDCNEIKWSLVQDSSTALCCVWARNFIICLYSTISTQEGRKMSQHDRKIVDWVLKHQHIQRKIKGVVALRKYHNWWHCQIALDLEGQNNWLAI